MTGKEEASGHLSGLSTPSLPKFFTLLYRCEVKETWWLINLQDEGYSEDQQKAAIQMLCERYLVEDGGIDDEDNRLVGQHNLIRSVAIEHRLMLPEN